MTGQLEDMRLLIEVIDRGSFSAAARRLGASTQLLSRRMLALEARLGVQLLTRTTRRLAPTDLGRDYAERARRILLEVEEAELAMSSRAAVPRGVLRLSAPLSFGVLHLSPIAAEFLSLHPGVEIDLDLTDRAVDLVAEGFDMAVRIGALPDSTLVARKLVSLRLVICASPDYLRRRGEPKTVAELKDHSCLLYRHSRGLGWIVRIGGRNETVAIAGGFRANNGEVLQAAAVAGLGLTQLPTFIVREALRDGRLLTVLDDLAPAGGAAYAVHPQHRQRSALVRAFTEHLVAALA